jgi:hypothetical protein
MRKLLIVGVAGAAAVAGVAVVRSRRRTTAPSSDRSIPVDVGFMLTIHAAMRRDLARLQSAARTGRPFPPGAVEGWNLFRRELQFHHEAEDEDLWPRVSARLTTPEDRAVIDVMYLEHARIPEVLESLDAAISAGVPPTVDDLAIPLVQHLDHEERDALPLVRTHLTDAEWHEFLRTERRKRPPRQRAEFLMWVLDDADPETAEPVLREVPGPGRFVYRNVLRRLYERRRLWPDGGAPADRHGVRPGLARAG